MSVIEEDRQGTATARSTTSARAAESVDAQWATLISRLSKASVEKHFDAYADVEWDSAELSVDLADPRFELPGFDPLGSTDWYRNLPPEVRSELGAYRIGACMKIGWHFENLLQVGLLRRAMWLRNGDAEFRYLHHELIEESQHTLMFQEFVNRSRLPIKGMPRWLRSFTKLVVLPQSTIFPALFFLHVLGGEDPVDHIQRLVLKDDNTHPLVARIMRIHLIEEARHLSFARTRLRRDVPKLGFGSRQVLIYTAPIVLGIMARMMFFPPRDLVQRYQVPRQVLHSAYRSAAGRTILRDSMAKPRRLWVELGLVDNPVAKALWKWAGIWEETA